MTERPERMKINPPSIMPYDVIKGMLDNSNIPYTELEHEAMFISAQEEQMTGLSESQGAKSISVKTKEGAFALMVMPGNKRLDTRQAKKVLGTNSIKFATQEEVKTVLGCDIGACYPFGSIAGIETIVDQSLLENDTIVFNPGLHTRSILLKVHDYRVMEQPKVKQITS